MSDQIKVGIVGYGNLGKGVEMALKQNPDMSLAAIFTRRKPEGLQTGAKAVHISDAEQYVGKIDVMLLCGGSATDLPEQGPQFAAMFNTVDSFDTHAKIPEFFADVDRQAREGGNVSIILKNDLGAKVGDIVEVEILGKAVTLSYLIVFGIPLVMALLGVILASAARFSELYSIITVAGSLVFGFLVVFVIDKIIAKNQKFAPKIIRVYNQNSK